MPKTGCTLSHMAVKVDLSCVHKSRLVLSRDFPRCCASDGGESERGNLGKRVGGGGVKGGRGKESGEDGGGA